MKVCFFSPSDLSVQVLAGDTSMSGGAEAQIAHLAATLASLGHQVDLIYGDGAATGTVRSIQGVRCIDAAPRWKSWRSMRTFWKQLWKSAPDLVYARQPYDHLWMLSLFARLSKRATFMYALAHDFNCNPWRTFTYNAWFHQPLYAVGLYTADIVALQHEGQRALIKPYTRAKSVLTPNLLLHIADAARTYDATTIDAIWVAKVRTDKQLDIFLDVVEALPELSFAMVGGFDANMDPQLCTQLQQRSKTLTNLTSFGPLHADEVLRLLAQSKVLVNTSRYEGFPNTMLEAWGQGVPVVSLTIDPGQVIQREQLGLVSGTPERLRHDLKRLVQIPVLNDALGARGLAYVRRYHSLEAVCRVFEQILPSVRQANTNAFEKGRA